MTDLERQEKNRIILAAHKKIVALKELMLEVADALQDPYETDVTTTRINVRKLREAAK